MKRVAFILWHLNAFGAGFLLGHAAYGHWHPDCTYFHGFHPVIRSWLDGGSYCEAYR